MIRALVVEDEAWARRHLAALLREFPGVEVVGEADTGAKGLAAAAGLKPDVIFTDIRMPGLDGVDMVRQLPEPRPAVVFTTAYADRAVEAFREGALHYLLKPIDRTGLSDALRRLFPGETARRDWLRIPVRRREGLRLLAPEAVDALVADLGDCLAWTAEGPQRVEGTLAEWEARLEPHGFCRTHRTALVRLAAVQGLAGDQLVLPVATRRLAEVRRALGA